MTRLFPALLALAASACSPSTSPSDADAGPGDAAKIAHDAADGGAAAGDAEALDGGARDAHAPAVARILDGDDWSLPAWVVPSDRAGFFSESADPAHEIGTRVVDLTWRQLVPAPGAFDTTRADQIYDMPVASFDAQLRDPGPFWLRLWLSGRDVAPEWVIDECQVEPIGTGYMGEEELPIWNACLWGHALELYRAVLDARHLRTDPRLRFVYVPGAFTYDEFDFDLVSQAVDAGSLDFAAFDAWFRAAMPALVDVMNGENGDPSDDRANLLVYTGEDYPFGPFGADDDLYARDAVAAGMGIRTGITELFDFHLSEVPAYGIHVAASGHMVVDEGWVGLGGGRVRATENECYDACGFSTSDPAYAVKMSNLKALQLRMNWIYVVPGDSYLDEYPELWRWVRLSLGKTAADAPDAWAALRDAEDRYWLEDDSLSWPSKPWVRNYERWLVQKDLEPDGNPRRGTDVRDGVLAPENGTAYEGLSTDLARGQTRFYFDLDDTFLHATARPVSVKVTYLDRGAGAFVLEYDGEGGRTATEAVVRTNGGAWRTATFELEDGWFGGRLEGGTDLALKEEGPDDLEVRFVRVVKR